MSVDIHVVDSTYGRPVSGMRVKLSNGLDDSRHVYPGERTDDGGNFSWSSSVLTIGFHTLELDLDSYFSTLGISSVYSTVSLGLTIVDVERPYQISAGITPSACFTFKTN